MGNVVPPMRVERGPVMVTIAAAFFCAAAGVATIGTARAPSISVASWFNEPFIVGASLLVGGVAGWVKRPDSRVGPLMCVAAILSWVPYLQDSRIDLVASTGYAAREAWVAVLIMVVLSYPNGRPTRFEKVVAVLAFAQVLVPNLASAFLLRLPPPLEHRSFFSVASEPALVARINHLTNAFTAPVLAGVIALLLLARVARGSRVSRAAAIPVLLGSGLTLLYFTFRDFTCGGLLSWSQGADTLAHAAIPLAFLVALGRGRLARGRMGGLLIDIGERPGALDLRDSLARALGDPTLSLAYRIASEDRWVDPDGATVDLPTETTKRAVSFLEREGEPVAAIIHDPALRDEPERLEPVRQAVRLLLDNERLTAEVRSQLAEVRASRKRIVAAADAARAKVQRDLHDGAQQRLVGLALNLRLAQRTVPPETALLFDEAAVEVQTAIQELRELSRGLHPGVLTEQGLAVAVELAASRCPTPTTLDLSVTRRYLPTVEATAYYVVTEALTNVAKYARASAVQLAILEGGGSLLIEIRDDGIGGADFEGGTGLRGLRDRVEAADGTILLESTPGSGTRLVAEIPVDTARSTAGAEGATEATTAEAVDTHAHGLSSK